MFIQHITIQSLGSLLFYDADFTPELNLLNSRHTAEIAAAIGFLLCNRASIPAHWVGECTRIHADIRLSEADFRVWAKPVQGRLRLFAVDSTGSDATVRYRYALSHCPEQDAMEAFDGQDKTIPFRLHRYWEAGEALSHQTRRMTDTRTFRRYLYQYFHGFQPESINSKKNYHATISPQGTFQVIDPGASGEISLSETEQKLFLYICFLNIAEFWGDFERLRDLHHEKKPLLIQNFLEFLDESVDVEGLLSRTRKLHRQIILLRCA